MSAKPVLYLIDANNQMYRAYHAPVRTGEGTLLRNAQGLPTNAVYIFVTMLRKLLKEHNPPFIAASFDLPGRTFRDDLAADYKANRAPMPDELAGQIPLVHRACEALGVPILTHERYEADDVIGTLTVQAAAQGYGVAIVTGDKDFFQLVRDGIRVYNPREEGTWFDAATVKDTFGVAPEQGAFADVLLLMCLFRASPPITSREQSENDENKRRIVSRGRQSDLQLLLHNREQPFRALAHELFDDMQPFAEMLDAAYGGRRYHSTMQDLRTRIDQPESTPSAQVLAGARAHGGFFNYTMALSQQHTQSLQAKGLDAATLAKFAASVETSRSELQQLETAEHGSFEDFVASYYA